MCHNVPWFYLPAGTPPAVDDASIADQSKETRYFNGLKNSGAPVCGVG
jgi:hypothetical protein